MGVPGCELLEGMTLHSLALRVLMRNHVLAATGRTPRPLNDFEIKPLEADLAAAHGGLTAFGSALRLTKPHGLACSRMIPAMFRYLKMPLSNRASYRGFGFTGPC
jgi:hypothetical protein